MRILVLGKTGQLGWELLRSLSSLGEITALDFPEIDLTQPEGVRAAIRKVGPQVIINATAYTDVDRAESEPEKAMAINGYGPGFVAQEAKHLNAALIHFSTDYVFDGRSSQPYTENDTPNPLGAYAQSKLAGEQWVQSAGGSYLIFRTAWLYSLRRPSFVTKTLSWARSQQVMRVVSDQVSNPTWARTLADVTAQVIAMGRGDPQAWIGEKRGLYHLSGTGYASRFEWAREIMANDPRKEEQTVKEILPALTTDFPTPAERPLFSALSCETFTKTFNLCLPPWQETLKLAMEQ